MSTQAKAQVIEGNLGEWPLEEIIDSLAATSKSGRIQIGASEIWFHSGSIYLVRTSSSPGLTETLFNAEVGSLTEIDDRFYSDDPRPVMDQLLQEYPESKEQLQLIVTEYNLAGLLELLVPSAEKFTIHPGAEHRLGAALAIEAKRFVVQAKHRLEIWKQIASAIPSVAAVFEVEANLPDSEPRRVISADEWKYLSQVNGSNSVEDIVHHTGESAFRVCTSLYRLKLEGLISEKSGTIG